MAKAKYVGPADRLVLYEAVIASVDGVDRKGAANPYTSRNGYMTSFIDKDGKVSLRLDRESREEFMDTYASRISVQHGSEMKEFVEVPDDLLERADEIRTWFVRSWEWVGTLKPKPTRK
jgi:hypothetical protein